MYDADVGSAFVHPVVVGAAAPGMFVTVSLNKYSTSNCAASFADNVLLVQPTLL